MRRSVMIRDEIEKQITIPCSRASAASLHAATGRPADATAPLTKIPGEEERARERKAPRTRDKNNLEAMSPALPPPRLLFDSRVDRLAAAASTL